MRPRRAAALWIAGALLAAGAAGAGCERVVAVGDLHGAYDPFVEILDKTGLIDEQLKWIGGRACLVVLGDVVDRGPRSREILDFLIDLERQAAGRVQVLLGNHETMNLTDDLRFVTEEEIAVFAPEETEAERDAAFAQFASGRAGDDPAGERTRREFNAAYPLGWFAHRRAFGPDGRYGKWLIERPVALRIGGTLFVHGGLSPADARAGLDKVNERMRRDIRSYWRLRKQLIDAGWIHPLDHGTRAFEAVFHRLQGAGAAEAVGSRGVELVATARRFLRLTEGTFLREDSPVWNRDVAFADEQSYGPVLDDVLREVGVKRMVVAHSPQSGFAIRSRFDNRAFLIDTGAGPAYGGRISALEITAFGAVTAVYLAQRDVLVEAAMTDEDRERFLLEATVVSSKEIGSGISRPLKLGLEAGGITMKAAFKSIDVRIEGVTEFKLSQRKEINFSDSYRYERAAYLVDRHLGMKMVPVAVERVVDGERGAVVEWVSDAISENERREDEINAPDPLTLVRQQDIMRAFDALIANTDRNLGNQLITTADWKLHLIDHSRAFRYSKKLTKGYEASVIAVPRWFYENLQNLDEKKLWEHLKGTITKGQLRAMLARRSALLKKFAADVEKFGEDMIFYDAPAP